MMFVFIWSYSILKIIVYIHLKLNGRSIKCKYLVNLTFPKYLIIINNSINIEYIQYANNSTTLIGVTFYNICRPLYKYNDLKFGGHLEFI